MKKENAIKNAFYNDEQIEFELTDYKGKKYKVTDKYGICLLPCQYTLNKSDEYVELLDEESSARAIFKEWENERFWFYKRIWKNKNNRLL